MDAISALSRVPAAWIEEPPKEPIRQRRYLGLGRIRNWRREERSRVARKIASYLPQSPQYRLTVEVLNDPEVFRNTRLYRLEIAGKFDQEKSAFVPSIKGSSDDWDDQKLIDRLELPRRSMPEWR